MAVPHCVQNVAGGVERWHVGHRISPGLGVAIAAHCACPRPVVHACTDGRGHAPARFHSVPSANRSRFQMGSRSLIASITNRLAS
jgi:hypothetical protein